MCVLAGFPQIVMLILYTVVLYVLLRVALMRGASAKHRGVVLVYLAASIVIAVMICAFQVLPTYELSRFSYRSRLPYGMVLSSAHHRLAALKYVVPDILGHPLGIGVLSKGLKKIADGHAGRDEFRVGEQDRANRD